MGVSGLFRHDCDETWGPLDLDGQGEKIGGEFESLHWERGKQKNFASGKDRHKVTIDTLSLEFFFFFSLVGGEKNLRISFFFSRKL